jgi:hypothetical protein
MKAAVLAVMAGIARGLAGCTEGGEAALVDASAVPAGAPECDAYVARYEACLTHVGEPDRAAAREALKAQRESFGLLSRAPAGRATMKATCQKLLDGLERNPVCK